MTMSRRTLVKTQVLTIINVTWAQQTILDRSDWGVSVMQDLQVKTKSLYVKTRSRTAHVK